MNRDIEFRGLTGSVKGDIWVYGTPYKVESLFGVASKIYYIRNKHANDHIVDPKTIGQYTGLKDKNGKKIFEGDIVKYDNDYIKQIGVIEWNDKNSSFQIKGISSSSMTHLKRMIVIGNIYENKELLEG